jgi:hypothetical protein
MQRIISADLNASAEDVYATLADLATYPGWLDIVTHVQDAPDAPTDAGPAWFVTLRAQVGPFSRSKRLRMVRTLQRPHRDITFVRGEVDGRRHSAWTLDVTTAGDHPCAVRVELRYEGRLWTAPLEAILGSEATGAVPRLEALVGRHNDNATGD